jgi:hypothetical protein
MRRLTSVLLVPCFALATAGALSSCAAPAPATLQQLRTRAAFDLGCAPEMLQVYELDRRARGVWGCGRRLAYVERCESTHGEVMCSWLLDFPGLPQACAAPTAAAERATAVSAPSSALGSGAFAGAPPAASTAVPLPAPAAPNPTDWLAPTATPPAGRPPDFGF